jgi:hypothetical protein
VFYYVQHTFFEFFYISFDASFCINNGPEMTLIQTLLVQDDKLYGEHLVSNVISRALYIL